MKVLDLFSGAGGCTRGYQLAGFEVTGVDIKKQRHYCGENFIQCDALTYLDWIIKTGEIYQYGLIHASPPCQGYSRTKGLTTKQHPMLIEPTRNLLIASGAHYVIENVVGAPLVNPIMLDGTMFGLWTVRKRLFECSFPITNIPPSIKQKSFNMGRKPEGGFKDGDYINVVGHFTDIAYARRAMQISWMSVRELAQAIPPAYTEFIAKEYLKYVGKSDLP